MTLVIQKDGKARFDSSGEMYRDGKCAKDTLGVFGQWADGKADSSGKVTFIAPARGSVDTSTGKLIGTLEMPNKDGQVASVTKMGN